MESRRIDRKLIIQYVIEIVKKTFHYLNALSTTTYTILRYLGTYFKKKQGRLKSALFFISNLESSFPNKRNPLHRGKTVKLKGVPLFPSIVDE